MHDPLQALEIAIVAVCLHEIGGRAQVHVAQGGDFELAVVLGGISGIISPGGQEPAQTQVNKGGVGVVDRILRVLGDAQVIVSEVGEERLHPAARVAGLAVGLALEDRKAETLLFAEFGQAFHGKVVFRGEGVHFG